VSEQEHVTFEIARKIRFDLTAAQVKVTELLKELAALELPSEAPACERCGVKVRGPRTLAEHIYLSHGGPEPAHWLEIEARSVDAA